MISQSLIHYSKQLQQQGLHRKRMLAACFEDKAVINFSSNDYLSLTADGRVKKHSKEVLLTIHPVVAVQWLSVVITRFIAN
ncbi:hypothetical protein [Legionella tunisiensis]|uniref:hypothetical protein n=1 Tax=Legionella tunisiensis TaxID=1034944 RepID=UPI0002F05C27|nr:hypothetical protein [Legionella tunisiensis]